MATTDDGDDERQRLRERVAELEQRLDDLRTADEVATDAQGREWSAADLMNIGLTRRQALAALVAMAGGATMWESIQQAIGTAEAVGSSQVGTIGDVGSPVDAYVEDLYDTNDNAVLEFQGDGSIKSVSADIAETTDVSSSDTSALGQGTTNYYSLLQKFVFDDAETRKIYGIHSQLDASAKDTNDGDLTAIYCAARTSDQDVWALNPLVEISDDGDGYAGANSYAIEADVNTDVAGIGRGLLLSGVGTANADVAVRAERMEGNWQSAIETKDVANYHLKAMDANDNLVFGIQPNGNVDVADSDIFNINLLKSSPSAALKLQVGGDGDRIVIQPDGTFDFYNSSGTKIARLDSNGDLVLAGAVTENGSP